MNSALRSKGQFRADGFDYVVVIRVYEADEGRFSVQVKPVFRRNLGPNLRIEARAEWTLGTNSTLEDAKRESQAFVEHNIRHCASELAKVAPVSGSLSGSALRRV